MGFENGNSAAKPSFLAGKVIDRAGEKCYNTNGVASGIPLVFKARRKTQEIALKAGSELQQCKRLLLEVMISPAILKVES